MLGVHSPFALPNIPAKDGQTEDIPSTHVHVESVHKTGLHAGFVYGSLPLANSAIHLRRIAVETAASMPPLCGSTTAGNSIYIRPVTSPVRPPFPPIRVPSFVTQTVFVCVPRAGGGRTASPADARAVRVGRV
jgi:hypothetical protein